jgi:hypothetical protein
MRSSTTEPLRDGTILGNKGRVRSQRTASGARGTTPLSATSPGLNRCPMRPFPAVTEQWWCQNLSRADGACKWLRGRRSSNPGGRFGRCSSTLPHDMSCLYDISWGIRRDHGERRAGRSLPGCDLCPAAGVLDADLLQAGPQSIGMKAEDPGSPLRPLDDAVRFLEDTEDVGTLHLLESRDWGELLVFA